VSETSHQPTEPGDSIPALKRRDRKRWQVGMPTLLLLTAAIAVWLTFFVNRRHNKALEAQIKAMSPLAHELISDDPKKIAVVKLEEYWYDENRWDTYLPDGPYRLCLATRGIDNSGLAPVVKSQPLRSGRHRLALEQRRDKDVWRITVAWDGTGLLVVEEPREWFPEVGSSSQGQSAVSEQLAADQPAVLLRRRFMREVSKGHSTTPSGPTEGILLWIERVE